MKQFLLLILIIVTFLLGANLNSGAQNVELYGVTSQGPDGPGTIFNMDANGAWYVNKFNFTDPGANPFAKLEQGPDGKFYGLASNGGANGFGSIFSYEPLGGTYNKVYSFDNTNGAYPFGSVTLGSDGKFYGLAGNGGTHGFGVIFSFDPTSNTYASLYSFDYTNGAYPHGSLTVGADGKFYGMTINGGAGFGVIFSFDPAVNSYSNLYSFDSTNGGNPYGNLTVGSDGLLYGVTTLGGSNGFGVVFNFDPVASSYNNLHNFDSTDGANPYGSLTSGSDGKFYGLAAAGGSGFGILFSYDPGTSAFNNEHNFDYTNGATPYGTLASGPDGRFYGLTYAGGSSGGGVIFSYDPAGSTFSSLKSFDFTNGANPYGSLTLGTDGTFYGMTYSGGSSYGVLFNFNPAGSSYSKLYSFDKPNGGLPHGGLTRGSDGMFYGMNSSGGSGFGIIFSFDPVANNFNKIYSFDYSNGANPNGSLTLGSDGKFYGMTYYGGGGYGVIFSFDPGSGTQTRLYSFDNANGANPYGSLSEGTDGKFYGVTVYGGSNNAGVIFSFDPGSSSYTNLYSFDNTNGGNPYGSLTKGGDGKFYGVTSVGGTGNVGVIFSFDPIAVSYSNVHSFDYTNGGNPYGNLTLGTDNRLYGLTANGGGGYGVIFDYTPLASTYHVDFNFNGTTGAYPIGSLTAGADGKLFGMTQAGGNSGFGVVFSYVPSSSTFSKIYDFNINSGRVPLNGQLSIYLNPDRQTPTVPASNITFSSVFSTQMKVSFTPGNGKKRLVVVREGLAVNWAPTDEQFYTPNANFTLATDQGSGNKVVMADNGSDVTLTGLKAATTYFVKVFEYNSTITESQYLISGPPSASKTTLAIPNVYVYIPANNAINLGLSVSVSTNLVAGATTYTIELNTSPDFSGTSSVMSGIHTQKFTGLAYGTKYYSRAKTDLSPDYGKVMNFTTATSEYYAYVTSPANGVSGVAVSPTVISNTVAGAVTYTIELSINPSDFTGATVKTGARTQIFPGLAYSTVYYTRVKTDLSPNYGVVKNFTTMAPLSYVSVPANNAVNQSPTPTITAVALAGATTYTLQLDTIADFTGTPITMSGLRTQKFTDLEYSKKYYAHVKTDLSTSFGKTTSFTTAPPESFAYVTSPSNGAANVSLTTSVISNLVVGATTYTIELSSSQNDFSAAIVKTGGRTLSFSGLLAYNTKYYSRVKTNLSPNYGAIKSFTTVPPSTYVTAPANNTVNQLWKLNVSANTVTGAGSYKIQLSPDPLFLSGIIENSGPSRTLAFSGLSYGTKYYCRATTDLASGAFGTVTSFTVANPSYFSYIGSPVNGATNVNWVVNLIANPVVDATTYWIEANTDPLFGEGTAIVNSGTSTAMGFVLAQDTPYYVRVKTDLSPDWGSTRTFSTGNELSLAYVTSPKNTGTGVPTSVLVYTNTLAGATSYTIELNTAPNFSGASITKTGINHIIAFTGLSENTTYYTRVKTNLGASQWGTTSTSFTTLNPGARGRNDWRGDESDEEVALEPFNVIVYGNPFHDRLSLLIESPEQQEAMVVLYDMTGRTIHESSEKTNAFVEIDKSMAQGIYLLRVRTGHGTKVIRVMKMD